MAWSDRRFGEYDVYAQRLDGSGVAQWGGNGEALCRAPGDQFFYAQYPGIASDGAGGAFVSWTDQRSGISDIYAQRVRSDGLILLPPDGVALCTAVGVQDFAQITSVGKGNAVVTWEDPRSDPDDVYAGPVPNTNIGFNVSYIPIPYLFPAPLYPVHLVFDHVVTAGFTYLDITPAGPTLPPSFVLGDGRYYNLSTTAGTTDNIDVHRLTRPLTASAAALRMFEYNVAIRRADMA